MKKKNQKNQILLNLKRIPVGLSGVSLGIAGWGAACNAFGIPYIKDVTSFIASCILIIFIFRNIFHFKVLIDELKHHTLGSFIPTFTMTSMIVASSIIKINFPLGKIIWYFSIILHIIYFSVFFYHRITNFDITHVVPSWFVPPIGIVVASTTSTYMGSPAVSQGIFYFGFIAFIIMFPMMLYRLTFIHFDIDRYPIFGIMGAPASLCLVGYLTSFNNPNVIMVCFLLTLAVLNTVLVYFSLPIISKVKFNPSFASLTFPLAIGATAVFKASSYFGEHTNFGIALNYIGIGELVISGIIISIVTIKMFKYILDLHCVIKVNN